MNWYKNTLSPISIKYKELLGKAETIESALAYEEYYCLTSVSHARCLAELGMFSIAQNELEEANIFWKQQARRISRDLLIGESPERFLCSDLAALVPTSSLISWLDFAYEEEKGFDWIDDLRSKNQIWYKDASKEAMKFTSSLFGNVTNYANGVRQNGLGGVTSPFFTKGSNAAVFGSAEEEAKRVIPSLHRLTARNNVLDGYLAQYQLMEDQKMTPLQLENKVKSISKLHPEIEFLVLSSSAEA